MKIVPALYYLDGCLPKLLDIRRRSDEDSVYASIVGHLTNSPKRRLRQHNFIWLQPRREVVGVETGLAVEPDSPPSVRVDANSATNFPWRVLSHRVALPPCLFR